MAPVLHVHLLGSFRLLYRGHAVQGFDQARLQELLAYLLLHRGHPISRQQLAFLFWPDSSEAQARSNLRTLWLRLRRVLPEADHFLAAGEMAVEWRSGGAYWLDVAAFEEGLQQAKASTPVETQVAALEGAVAAYGGELLPGCYSDWLLALRDRLNQAYGAALEQLVVLGEARRDYRWAIGHAQALLRHDPLHEPAYAQLMRLHALNDDRAASLHTYHTCATVLRRELDVEPGPATRRLYQQLLTVQLPSVAPAPAEAAIPLVGREAPWEQLQRAWRLAAHRPRLVVITGEAGIGKTRLAEALAEWVERQGIPALVARCFAAGGDLAYAPAVAWLRSQPLPSLADPWLRELARLLPEIGAERPDLPAPAPLTERWQRLRLFEALAHALLAGRSALLLVLDDLQWCDRDTLDWLHYLLAARPDQSAHGPVLVAATLRSEGSESDAGLAPWRAELARSGQLSEIELGPLSQDATLALAGQVAGRPFDQALATLLYQGTEGHPLFVVEMVRAGLAAAGREPARHAASMLAAPAALPDKVRQVLDARLAQLSPQARGVVDLAAVVGRAFTFDMLAAASDLGEELLVAALDEGWRRRIIREQGAGAYDFSHEKLRETAYAGLSQTRRRWLHGQVARALEQVHAGDLDAAAGVLAGHWEAAGRPAQASAYYSRAAARARRLYAHQDALTALEKALSLAAALPDAADRERMAARLQEDLGDLYELQARHASARDAYAAALACTASTDAIAQARLHRKLGKSLENERASYETAAAHYASAEALLGPPDDAAGDAWWEEWCQVQVERLILLYWWNRTDEMAQQIRRVQPSIERHGTPLQQAAMFGNLSRHLNRSARYAPSDAALAYARAALAALPPASSPETLGSYQFGIGFNLLWHGEPAKAQAALSAALALAEQTGDISLQARCLAYLAVAHRRQGDAAAVADVARRGMAVAESAGMLDYVGACQANLAWLAWRQGDTSTPLSAGHAEAERLGQAALEAWQRHPAPYPLCWQALWPLLGVDLAQARLAEAISHARQLLDLTQQALPPAIEQPLVAALAAWDADQPAAAHDLLLCAIGLAQNLRLD